MTLTVQLLIVGLLVALATAYLVRSTWKTWFGKTAKTCGAGCGKCSTTLEKPQDGRFSLPQI
jgi:hypothetical protein